MHAGSNRADISHFCLLLFKQETNNCDLFQALSGVCGIQAQDILNILREKTQPTNAQRFFLAHFCTFSPCSRVRRRPNINEASEIFDVDISASHLMKGIDVYRFREKV